MPSDLGDFLRTRRAALSPADLGFAAGSPRRRVPGLRREELALLAGISVDYYVRLEQGRTHNVSDSVLDAVADALRLDPDERAYLYGIGRPPRQEPDRDTPQRVRPGLLRLLESLHQVPALVLGRRMDVLAWNARAAAVLVDFAALPPGGRNFAKLVFLGRGTGGFPHFDHAAAEEVVGALRAHSVRHPGDPGLAELVDELKRGSGHFGRLWSSQTVRRRPHGIRELRHPGNGTLRVCLETLVPADDPDQMLLTYTPADTALPLPKETGGDMAPETTVETYESADERNDPSDHDHDHDHDQDRDHHQDRDRDRDADVDDPSEAHIVRGTD
ncbi:helix-turn-helix domain-containing protein [Streptomyces sp. NPDC048751]|uniref:helix-turn-helix domain-containing protein n=1 Tax=Streptomyces sp. NPDC048751 TaxID=3365591 RepID=UPI003717352F